MKTTSSGSGGDDGGGGSIKIYTLLCDGGRERKCF